MKIVGTVGLLAALGASACTAVNPDYLAPDNDGSAPADADEEDLAAPDLAAPAECKVGERACQKGTEVSQGCVGGRFQPERVCPSESRCVSGYCDPPPPNGTTQGNQCMLEGQCAVVQSNYNYTCMPFVDDMASPPRVELRCGRAIGQGGPGAACVTGNECRTGYCVIGKGNCFRACLTDVDCPFRQQTKTVCRSVRIRVEGVDAQVLSCVLP